MSCENEKIEKIHERKVLWDRTTWFCDNLKKCRLERDMSQEELASKAALHRTYICDLEKGKRNPSLKTIECLAVALEMEPWQLLYDREWRDSFEKSKIDSCL